jgi:hypothetical protein
MTTPDQPPSPCALQQERRQFVSDLLAATISTCALLVVPIPSFSLEDSLKSQIDKQFSLAVSRVAALRETNRSTAIVVTHLFKELTDKHCCQTFDPMSPNITSSRA